MISSNWIFLSLQSKKIGTKSDYSHLLHTCVNSYQPRGNKKIMTNISPILSSGKFYLQADNSTVFFLILKIERRNSHSWNQESII